MAPLSSKIEYLTLHLQERVKELTCLYAISKIAQDNTTNIEETLQKIPKVISSGWQFPNELMVNIKVDDKEFGEPGIRKPFQKALIKINNRKRGTLTVWYDNEISKTTGVKKFLKEEQQLINQIAVELSTIIDRHELREREKLHALTIRNNDRLNVLGELTGGIAHELNTPLGNILGYAELLKRSETDFNKKEDLQKIIVSTLNAREIVKKLMYFSCDMPSQFDIVDLNKIIVESVDLLQIQLKDAMVKTVLNLDEEIPKRRIDPIQFSQVIFNLVLNAIASMPNGGVLEISTGFNKNQIILKIKDEGCGINKSEIHKIFQPFFTTKKSGTGLGLAVVHGIVQSHQGAIQVSSKLGKGTEFIITLPYNKLK